MNVFNVSTVTLLMTIAAVSPQNGYTSDLVGVALALLGGLAAQLRSVRDNDLTACQIGGELLASALGGFIAHSIAIEQVESQRIIWSSCIGIGFLGSAGLRYLVSKFYPGSDDD